MLRGEPSGKFAPVQKTYQGSNVSTAVDAHHVRGLMMHTSAEDAARGQVIGSKFSGPDCSVQRGCWPRKKRKKKML